jgi:non-homologous end joining protein Ku
VIDSLVGDWNIADFENEYRRDLRAMLEAKLAGEEIKRPAPVAETPVVDLMEALRRSVADVQDRKSGKAKSAASGSASRRKTPARKAS